MKEYKETEFAVAFEKLRDAAIGNEVGEYLYVLPCGLTVSSGVREYGENG